MAQNPLPPPPPSGGVLDGWLYLLWRRLTQAGQILWESITPGTSADVAAVVTDETGSPGSLVFSGNPTLAGITDSGDLVFTGTGNRITGDFSNATIANRVIFQSTTTNGNTFVPAMPNGTGTIAGFGFYNANDPDNASFLSLSIQSTQAVLASTKTGTGSYLDLNFQVSGTTKATIAADGVVTLGGAKSASALKIIPDATPSTQRRVEITAGSSTGNPTIGVSGGNLATSVVFMPVQATTAGAPAYVLGGMYYDTTLNKLRIGGATAWETVTSI